MTHPSLSVEQWPKPSEIEAVVYGEQLDSDWMT